MRKKNSTPLRIITCLVAFLIIHPLFSQTVPAYKTIRYHLSGTDKDHTVVWDFFCTKGRKSGNWTKIAVPSNWEQQGFGGYNYGHDKIKSDEQGMYRFSFPAPAAWKHKTIFIVFEGVMTDARVLINGTEAGPVHQGGFYRFKYNITSLIRTGSNNLLQVEVSKMSANASVNHAERQGDFWVFGGIYRPVYLEIMPEKYIERVAVDARADGVLHANVYTAAGRQSKTIRAQVRQIDGKAVGMPFTATVAETGDSTSLRQKLNDIRAWHAESPALYELDIALLDARGNIQHQVTQRFGFRTVEIIKHDGIYVNRKRVVLKGINHHSEWPETGRTLSKAIDSLDIALMKEMNMNAVRMSHYPPDQSFLDLCDSIGLFVLDELTGWQAKYDTVAGRKLVKELVERDVNHPSIILWDNGNEGGWNRALDGDYALYDPQHRQVIHPWERFNGFDTKHYPAYNYVVNSSLYDSDIYMPTEFMHGLYDGGHGAGLEDFWNLMSAHPACAGGFLWAFLDEAVARTDKNGRLDTDGNHAPDGIVGPHREKEASFYTVKEIWSPVQVRDKKLRAGFDGRLAIENHYSITNLDRCSFAWKIVRLSAPGSPTSHETMASGACKKTSIAPGETGYISISLPGAWRNGDVLYVTVTDPYQRELVTWSWAISSPAKFTNKIIKKAGNAATVTVKEDAQELVVSDNNTRYHFSKATGYLLLAEAGGKQFPLRNGPSHAGISHKLHRLLHYALGNDYVVEPEYESDSFRVKWIFTPGLPARLEYSYLQKNNADFTGITFDYPEDQVSSMTWAGQGPYRVWKNRLKGGKLGVWHKEYNNTVTGESWVYPEFKGYHADMYWVTIESMDRSFTVFTENEHLFLQMLKPASPSGAGNTNTSPAFPEGNLGFMNTIPAIGTKFKPALDMGPQSQQNMMLNYTPVSGALWFDFRQHGND